MEIPFGENMILFSPIYQEHDAIYITSSETNSDSISFITVFSHNHVYQQGAGKASLRIMLLTTFAHCLKEGQICFWLYNFVKKEAY